MKSNREEMEIDLVYLWVDGSDPVWRAKRHAFLGEAEEVSELNCKGRYADNDELKYSLRSVEKYAPWIRKIFIVTDNQIPNWMEVANPKIQIIHHQEMMPEICLPSFNPCTIEGFLHKIPDLSEHFLFANDDMFLGADVQPDFFFAKDGYPIVRLNRKPFRQFRSFMRQCIRKKPFLHYSQAIFNATELVKKRFGVYYNGLPHHNIDAYLKSNCQRVVEQIFKDEFDALKSNHIRSLNDIQRIIYSFVALAEKRGYLHYSSKKESLHIGIHNENHYQQFEKYKPVLFCMNDSQYAQDSDRMRLKAFLEKLFPEKSEFEKAHKSKG